MTESCKHVGFILHSQREKKKTITFHVFFFYKFSYSLSIFRARKYVFPTVLSEIINESKFVIFSNFVAMHTFFPFSSENIVISFFANAKEATTPDPG